MGGTEMKDEQDTSLSVTSETFPGLAEYSLPVVAAQRAIVGREKEINQLLAAMARPELCNALLLGPAGSGKSALVQGTMLKDHKRVYREVDLSKMISGSSNADEMAHRLKSLFDEAADFTSRSGVDMVLFMDELHQIVQLSPVAVEALKPLLANSGTRGIRVIAATTFEEFAEYIRPNQALVERLQRLNLEPPAQPVVVEILRGMAKRYKVENFFQDDHLFNLMVELTDRYNPASVQPRKSILLMDAMIGYHRQFDRDIDERLMGDVIGETTGVNISFQMEATTIRERLDLKVYGQTFATRAVERRLQICVADLHDKGKPLSSFLFTGSTGVGKALADSVMVPVLLPDGSAGRKRHGDLEVGDRVFQRNGEVEDILGVFPQGVRDIYRLHLSDGRTLDADGEHLWPIYTSKMRSNKHSGQFVLPKNMTTAELVEAGVIRSDTGDDREHPKFFLPMNEAVQWPARDLPLDPYTLGAFIGNDKVIQTADVFSEVPELINTYSRDRRIPESYLLSSIEQRWELVRGLFDTDGTIDGSTGRFNVSYSTFSSGLADDLRELLFSLGVSSSVTVHTRERDGRDLVEYHVHVKVGNEDKVRFFSLPRKVALAQASVAVTASRTRVKKFDMVGIASIEKLSVQEHATCIFVSGEEHLYQAGQFVVTHNTELAKQLSFLLFGPNSRRLIRFDMSEYSQVSSLDLFRKELTEKVWSQGHAVVMFDEMEKASEMHSKLLLQVLDDGRLSDENGRETSFLNCYIIMTTNAGSDIFKTIAQYSVDDEGSGKGIEDYQRQIRDALTSKNKDQTSFPPELLGRIDTIVPFQPLSEAVRRKVVKNKLFAVVHEVLDKHNIRVQVDHRVMEYLLFDKDESASDSGGARRAIATLTSEVVSELATFINANPKVRWVDVYIDGVMRAEDKTLLKSEAKVMVTATPQEKIDHLLLRANNKR